MINKIKFSAIGFFLMFALTTAAQVNSEKTRKKIAQEIEYSLQKELLDVWYPACLDSADGGFLSTFNNEFKATGKQDKFLVTQARHTWTTAKAAALYPDKKFYPRLAQHGFEFLRDKMWDKEYGGFYDLVDKKGNVLAGGESSKTAYGNSFAIYALAAYYQLFKDPAVLDLVRKSFLWMENHSHDPVHLGYFQHLDRDGTPLKRKASTPPGSALGYKDQNSSIHLLEAFTELYAAWPDSLVRVRLQEMFDLVSKTITNEKGDLVLFFQPDWTPVSFRDSSKNFILQNHQLDHASFGHDIETAYLLLEAAEGLGIKDIRPTLTLGKKMVDHALKNGWDEKLGGFYDEGYYFKDSSGIIITLPSKNWWAQAEGLNTLLLMANYFPDDPMNYFEKFVKQWNYIDEYLIDHDHGDWYQAGLDETPDSKSNLKGHIWKGAYHNFRSLANCIKELSLENSKSTHE